eukprot:g1767.t1
MGNRRSRHGEDHESTEGLDIRAHDDTINAIAAISTNILLSASDDASVAVVDARARKISARWSERFGGSAITRIRYVAKDDAVVTGSRDASIRLMSRKGNVLSTSDRDVHTSRVTGLCVAGDYICTGSRDNRVCVLDRKTLKVVKRVCIARNLVTNMCGIDAHSVAQVSEDLTLRVWDLRGEMRTPAQIFKGFRYFALDVAASADERTLLTTSKGDNGHGCEGRVWDRRRASDEDDAGGRSSLVRMLHGHRQSASACSFLANSSDVAVTGSHDGTVRLWDVSKGTCLGATDDLDDAVTCLDVAADDGNGNVVFVGTASGAVRMCIADATERGTTSLRYG